jgi:mono/diheme cytochrome c family protein
MSVRIRLVKERGLMTGRVGFLAILIGVLAVPLAFSADASSAAAAGEATFKAKCSICHGADGSAKTMMGERLKIRDMHSEDVQKQSDAELTGIITNGKGKMTPYKGKLSEEQITQVVSYIREIGKKN